MRTLRESKADKKLNNEGFFAKQKRKDDKLTSAQKLEAKRELEVATWENMVDAKYVGDVRDTLDDLVIGNSRRSDPFYAEASLLLRDDTVKLSQLSTHGLELLFLTSPATHSLSTPLIEPCPLDHSPSLSNFGALSMKGKPSMS